MPIFFAELTGTDLEKLTREQTVFFFPVGGFEDHGPHLPLSLDLDEAIEQCVRLGKRIEADRPGWRAVIMPSVPFAIDPVATRLALPVRAHVLRDWLVDASRALRRNGFMHAVCFSGSRGPRQLTTIEEAGKSLTRWSRLRHLFARGPGARTAGALSFASLTSGLTSAADLTHSAWWPAPQEHGGARDTSIAMALGRVKPLQPPAHPLPSAQNFGGVGWARVLRIGIARARRVLPGYWG